jgi:hypothetical protein
MTGAADWTTVPPAYLRRLMLAVTALTCLAAAAALVAIALTAVLGGEGESRVGLALIGLAVTAIMLHAGALGRLLLHGERSWLLCNGVLLGGIALLAVSGAAVVAAELDDSPGGVLAGLLLATQGGTAVLAVALPQLLPPRSSRA